MSANNGAPVGVFMGGTSSEREVSLRSGEAVFQALAARGISAVRIDPKEAWQDNLKQTPIRAAFLALHGQGGEDGVIQSELERIGIPYTGSSARASHTAFCKDESKRLFDRAGIPTPHWTLVTRADYLTQLKGFPFPVFSKPLADGSSIGVYFVPSLDEFIKREDELFAGEKQLLIEERIEGREFTVGVLETQALPLVELRPKGFFYDYHSKYTAGQTEYLVPAPVDERLAQKAQRLALETHEALGLRDYSRVDMMMNKNEEFFVLEANTIPGFTSLSLFPKAARAVGISFEDLCLKLLELAQKRN